MLNLVDILYPHANFVSVIIAFGGNGEPQLTCTNVTLAVSVHLVIMMVLDERIPRVGGSQFPSFSGFADVLPEEH